MSYAVFKPWIQGAAYPSRPFSRQSRNIALSLSGLPHVIRRELVHVDES